jgi:hypothetical protein
MIDDRDDELSPEERSSLAALPSTLEPPDHLERRIESELRARGLLRTGRMEQWRAALVAAAMVVAFAGGWAAHEWSVRPQGRSASADVRQRYMLLLYGAESAPGEEAQRVNEYRAWAGSIASSGAHVSGEKLDDRAIVLGGEPGADPDANDLGGFFIISAGDDQAAEALARTHPHLRHGGRVLIRPVAR